MVEMQWKGKLYINATGKEITKSFTEIDIMTVGTINNTARSVSSLRLLTDVR
jgi:hypothetical protein